ncbi:MAG: oxidoreductase [Oxalobacter formigenes]|nr:oxidoreductase [Oxalobacter formigenes]
MLISNEPFNVASNDYERSRYEFEEHIRNMYACLPVKVISVNAAGLAPVGFVDIQPTIQQRLANGGSIPYPVIYNAPYFRLQGGANAIIIDPQPGDIGIACFASRDMSGTKRQRGMAAAASLRKWSMSDAIYIGGILNNKPVQFIKFDDDGIMVLSPKKVTVQAPEVLVDAQSQITLDSPLILVTGALQQTGAKGRGAQTSGGLANTGGTISSNGIVLDSHVHSGVQAGGSNTGGPV